MAKTNRELAVDWVDAEEEVVAAAIQKDMAAVAYDSAMNKRHAAAEELHGLVGCNKPRKLIAIDGDRAVFVEYEREDLSQVRLLPIDGVRPM